jgi:hypothetical protein
MLWVYATWLAHDVTCCAVLWRAALCCAAVLWCAGLCLRRRGSWECAQSYWMDQTSKLGRIRQPTHASRSTNAASSPRQHYKKKTMIALSACSKGRDGNVSPGGGLLFNSLWGPCKFPTRQCHANPQVSNLPAAIPTHTARCGLYSAASHWCCCSWSQTLVDEGLAEQFIPLDFAEADTVLDRALKVGGTARVRGWGLGGGGWGGWGVVCVCVCGGGDAAWGEGREGTRGHQVSLGQAGG